MEGTIQSSMANFGIYNYGTEIQGRLAYPIQNTDGCNPFSEYDFVLEHLDDREKSGLRPIIMVDRGNCHFVQKAQNIQNFGGVMMVVVDNKENETPDMINMVDDGKGASITIPSFLISFRDGQKLIDEIHAEMN